MQIRDGGSDAQAQPAAGNAILAGIQGGVVMLMSTGDLTPLEAALDLAIGYLRSRAPAAR